MSRVFVGIPLSPAVQEKALQWEHSHGTFPVRWISGKNLHVTLVPPWEELNIPPTLRNLSALSDRFSPFSIRFTRITLGPGSGEPNLIWATGAAPGNVVALAEAAHEALGIPLPERTFTLHTTLARFRPEEIRTFPVRTLNEPVDWEMRIERVVLFESRRGPHGADYYILGEVTL